MTLGKMMQLFALRNPAFILLMAAWLLAPITAGFPLADGMAWADDDDGGDDDDDDGGGGSSAGNSSPSPVQTDAGPSQKPQQNAGPGVATVRRRDVVTVLAAFAPELVVVGLASGDLTILLQEGYIVLESRLLGGTGAAILRLAPPPALALDLARDRVRQLASGATADFNHFYRVNEDLVSTSSDGDAQDHDADQCLHANCPSFELIQWPSPSLRGRTCSGVLPTIGIIDTGVNITHDLIDGSRIEIIRLGPDTADASRQIHGTAVASAFTGRLGSRVEGLLPEARLLVVDVFSMTGDDERADVFSLIRGLDLMAARSIRVVNLSLAGPANEALAAITQQLVLENKMALVAAVGNGGPDKPVAFPAALPGVIAVTAVDRRGRLYADAQRGPEVDIAAPGVGLLLATSVAGAKEKTGTSFAAPFITASAALLIAQDPLLTPAQIALRLTASARDLGEAGADNLFGAGLLQTARLCH
jgi:minor extracellular protease Epr